MALDTFEARGGPVEIYEDHVTINSRILSFFKVKLEPTDVFYAQVKKIERHPKGTRPHRYPSFHIETGGDNRSINMLENEMTFDSDQQMQEAYGKVMKYYQAYLNNQRGASIVQQSSPADELKKFKELLDSGIITQEEFNAKKKKILGL